jgi:hypothetical protein
MKHPKKKEMNFHISCMGYYENVKPATHRNNVTLKSFQEHNSFTEPVAVHPDLTDAFPQNPTRDGAEFFRRTEKKSEITRGGRLKH